MGQVVDGVRELGVVGIRRRIGIGHDTVGAGRGQAQVDDEITAIQIHVNFQGLHRELHGRDAGAQFVVGYHLIPLQIVVGRRDRENVPTTYDADGGGVRLIGGGVVVLYASCPPPICAGRSPAVWGRED